MENHPHWMDVESQFRLIKMRMVRFVPEEKVYREGGYDVVLTEENVSTVNLVDFLLTQENVAVVIRGEISRHSLHEVFFTAFRMAWALNRRFEVDITHQINFDHVKHIHEYSMAA
jgi:hypothetical protein